MDKWPEKLVIVRHAQSEVNIARERLEQFHSDALEVKIKKEIRDADIKLTPLGEEQACKTGAGLKKEFGSFDIAFVSPYARTQQTAEYILRGMDCKPDYRLEERLREKEFGSVSHLTKKGIAKYFPHEYARLQLEGKYYFRPPGGESYPDVNLRVYSALNSILRSAVGKSALVVTHSVVVKSFRKTIEHQTEQEVLMIDKVDDVKNCGVTTYSFDKKTGKMKLDYYNKTFY